MTNINSSCYFAVYIRTYVASFQVRKNAFHTYIVSLLRAVEWQLNAYQKKRQPEILHRMRVDIKKIKALLSFLAKVFNDKTISASNSLRPLFHQAGCIRELQINSKLLKELPQPPLGLIKKMAIKEKRMTEQFCVRIPAHLLQVKQFVRRLELPDELPKRKKIKKYFKKKIKKALKELNLGERDSLHRFRMEIKKLMYVHKALPRRLRASITLDEKYIDRVQKKAGDWHDAETVIKFLKSVGSIPDNYISKMKEKEIKNFNALKSIAGNQKKW